MLGGGGCGITVREMDLFEVFLELPIINKSFFPFRNKLTFKLL